MSHVARYRTVLCNVNPAVASLALTMVAKDLSLEMSNKPLATTIYGTGVRLFGETVGSLTGPILVGSRQNKGVNVTIDRGNLQLSYDDPGIDPEIINRINNRLQLAYKTIAIVKACQAMGLQVKVVQNQSDQISIEAVRA
jgi:hypothetical protein